MGKYWFDTEFIEDGKTIDLLSIGIVSEDGREYYAENQEADRGRADEWVKQHVFPFLHDLQCACSECPRILRTRAEIAAEIFTFCSGDKPEFWAYYADYDWVVLCQLFGRMIDLPKGWPMYCRDIKQLADQLGNPALPQQQEGAEHNALEDARWNRIAWEFLQTKGTP